MKLQITFHPPDNAADSPSCRQGRGHAPSIRLVCKPGDLTQTLQMVALLVLKERLRAIYQAATGGAPVRDVLLYILMLMKDLEVELELLEHPEVSPC